MNLDLLKKIREEKTKNYNGMKKINSLFLCNLSHKAGLSLMKHGASALGVFLDFIDIEYSDFFTLLNFKKEDLKSYNLQNIYILLDENYYLDEFGHCEDIALARQNLSKLKDEINASLTILEELTCNKIDIVISTLYLNSECINEYISLDERNALSDLVFDFNMFLAKKRDESKHSIHLVSMAGFRGKSIENIYSEHNTVASLDYLNFFSGKSISYLRLSEGKSLKCIITDLDNTVWGGVAAEGEYENNDLYNQGAYRKYQKWLKCMHRQGVILSISSKNDFHVIKDFFSEKTHALEIQWSDFSFPEINWDNKSDNILKICKNLNLSPEHVLFVDDSDFELEEVTNAIPNINTFHFSKNIDENIFKLVNSDFFIKGAITLEDRLRNESFANNIKRDEFYKSNNSKDDFLKNISMELSVSNCTPENHPRTSDLTMRTNQFNLTTMRMDTTDVQNYVSENSGQILLFRFSDRFGSYGIIGASFLKIEADACLIENIVLSCRAFERGVEFAIIKSIGSFASAEGCSKLIGSFIETIKNKKFKNFYTECGFGKISNNIFSIDIDDLDVSEKCKNITILRS